MVALGGVGISYERGTPVGGGGVPHDVRMPDFGKHLFRGGLVFKAHILLHHSTLGWRVIKKKQKKCRTHSWSVLDTLADRTGHSVGSVRHTC